VVVSGGWILRGVVLRAVLAIVLRVVLAVVPMLLLLSAAPEEASMGWRGGLVSVTLVVVIWDEGHVRPRDLPSPVHAKTNEDREYDRETGDCDGDTCSSAQPFPANGITETNGEVRWSQAEGAGRASGLTSCDNSKSRPLRRKITRIG